MRNVMGSWPFVFVFLAIMLLWGASNTLFLANILHHKQFDPYPYVFLNLFLSMLAGLQGAILLIAAKRADSIASEQALHHLHLSEGLIHMVEESRDITKAIRRDTGLLQEIREHVTALSPAAGAFEPDFKPASVNKDRHF